MERHVRHLEPYYLQKQALLSTYPHVLTLDHVDNISLIATWISEIHLDCKWHTFLFRDFDFTLGYDFFFRQGSDAMIFKLTWGGIKGEDLPIIRSGFFLGEQWIP